MSTTARHERATGQRRPTGAKPPGRPKGRRGPWTGGLSPLTARDREIRRQFHRLAEVPGMRLLVLRPLELARPGASADDRAEAIDIAALVTRVLAALSRADGDAAPPLVVRSGWEGKRADG